MRAKRAWLGAVAVATALGVLGGCARPVDPGSGRQPVATSQSPSTTSQDRQTGVYASVLHYFLTSGDTSFGEHRFQHLFMRDVARSGGALGRPTLGEPIPVGVQEALVTAVADLGSLEFIHGDSEVIDTIDGCPQVRDGGILITLAPVPATGNRVEIAVEGFVACLGAVWLTYIVELTSGTWHVTGTTGPVAIA
jgi:hypothetical protein